MLQTFLLLIETYNMKWEESLKILTNQSVLLKLWRILFLRIDSLRPRYRPMEFAWAKGMNHTDALAEISKWLIAPFYADDVF
jgi:hypothetical protein